ncbi:unnamed protein product [Durusdinium trenchii]|uniref:Uncharacterized protein n=1 Tax=Durusdinium trenchii TaxID=1381693 RepID=A0ABP0R670_9DINO
MSKRRRVHNEEGGRGRTDGRTWAIGLCLTVAVLFALASLQVLDVPQIGLTEPHKTIQKANVAEALLRLEKNQKSARLERTALEGGAPSSTLRAEPTGHLDGSVAGAPSTTPPGQSNASEPEMIWYDLPRRSPLNAQIDLVIAAFREDLSWINVMMEPMASDFALRLYCKGDRLKDPRCLRIDNFGGEEYAYLTHITHFYDDLAPITIFTLGSIYDRGWDWLKCRKLNFVLSQLDTPERRQNFPGFATMAHTKPDSFHEFEGFFTLTKYQNHAGGTKTASCRASITPLQKWFEAFINVSLAKARHTGVLYNPIFAVSRERIRQFPSPTITTEDATATATDITITATPNITAQPGDGDQILEWLEFHATQLDNPNRPQHQYIANILTDCNITYKEITDFRQYTHAKWNDATHQYDQFQYYAISLPFLNTKATTPEPPAVSRATSTHREVAHINAGHTGPVGNISNILRQGRFLPSTLHFANYPGFFAQGVRITHNQPHDHNELARIIHNTWQLHKNSHSLIITLLAWGAATKYTSGGEEHAMNLLNDHHGAVFHQKGRCWVIHPDHAIVKGLAWSTNSTPPDP